MDNDENNKMNLAAKAGLLLILVVFVAFSIFIALRLAPGIAPDEQQHFLLSKLYAETPGIPRDSDETIVTGWVVRGSPFLYYWLNARAINIVTAVYPAASDMQLLVVLRLVNVVLAAAAMVVLYLASKELIRNRWLQLLPVFLLANTLMWVFLAGAVSYDNLANLLSFAAILFFIRAYKEADFHKNAWLWIVMIALGCLVKYTLVPLAGLMVLIWAVTGKLKQQFMGLRTAWSEKRGVLVLMAALLTVAAGVLYGSNLVRYHSLIPTCADLMDTTTCALDPMLARYHDMALPEKLTIAQSIEQGYPNPLEYIFYSWIPNMLYRIHGILAHQSYFPAHVIIVFYILMIWYVMLGYKYLEHPGKLLGGLAVIFLGYAGILLIMNYNSELVYGFRQISMQGRYLFPVIGIAYIFSALILEAVKSKTAFWVTVGATILLFLLSGPIKFITHSQSVYWGWFG